MSYADLVAQVDRVAMAALGGEVVTYTPATGPAITPMGIFDSVFVLAKGGGMAGVEATSPAIFFRLSDLPIDPEFDDPTLMIRGLHYRVAERMPDDMGGIVLALRRIT